MTKPSSTEKWSISVWSVLAVFVIFNPVTYWITNKLFGLLGAHTLQMDEGPLTFAAPTMFGFTLHLVVFFLLVRVMMEIKLPGVKDT
jgi:hypothetical protein